MRARSVRMWAASTAGAAALTVGLLTGVPNSDAAAAPASASSAAEVVRYGQPSLYTENVDEMLTFYHEAFGFHVDYRFPAEGSAVFGTASLGDSYYLTFATYDVIRDSTPLRNIGPSPIKQSELVVITTDVDGMYAEALKAGAEKKMAPTDQPWGERSAYVADPEGNLVQISTHHG
jgi:lactoylglutathione lyase